MQIACIALDAHCDIIIVVTVSTTCNARTRRHICTKSGTSNDVEMLRATKESTVDSICSSSALFVSVSPAANNEVQTWRAQCISNIIIIVID